MRHQSVHRYNGLSTLKQKQFDSNVKVNVVKMYMTTRMDEFDSEGN